VSAFYVVDRMLAEFAAAAVVFAKATHEGSDDGEVGDGIRSSVFSEHIQGIVQASCPTILRYYSRCLERSQKHFTWTGPQVQIRRRSDELNYAISLAAPGELLELPGYAIYTDLDPIPRVAVGKRHVRTDSMNLGEEQPQKRRR